MSRRRATRSRETGYAFTGAELEARLDMAVAPLAMGMRADPANADVYAPRETQRVPKVGAWGMVTRALPPMERDLDQHVRVGRVFWLAHESHADDAGFLPDGTYRVESDTPWGTVKLWPYEYAVQPAATLLELWQGGVLTFHPLHTGLAQFNAVVFYARSRGIALADAMVMALGSLTGPVGWFEPATPELAEWAEGLAERLHAPFPGPHNVARRAAARARRKEGA